MTSASILLSRVLTFGLSVVFCAGLLVGCDDPKSDIKEFKSLVQISYGAKKYKESGANAAKGLKLALETVGPKHPDTLYFAQAVSEAYIQTGDKKNALSALTREIDLRIGAGQTEQKLQARRTFAIKFAEEVGDKSAAAKQAVAIAKAIGMQKGMDPQPVFRTETKYPPALFSKGVEGDVTVAYSIDANGTVLDAKVIKAIPRDMFDTAALESFKAWRFTPMLENGMPVQSSGHQFTLMFRLGK